MADIGFMLLGVFLDSFGVTEGQLTADDGSTGLTADDGTTSLTEDA